MEKLQPKNPEGSCFDSAAWLLLENLELLAVAMCHGIGTSNHPKSMGAKISHAWIEFDDNVHGRVAVDPIYLIAQCAETYRSNLRVEFVLTYTASEFIRIWKKRGFPGPFEAKLKKHIKD